MEPTNDQVASPEPVAYDKDGNPLYAAPVQNPQVVHMARPFAPKAQIVPIEIQKRVDASKAQYPYLNLSTGEYVISAIRRHPIGLLGVWTVVGLIIVLLFVAIPFVLDANIGGENLLSSGKEPLAYVLLVLATLTFLGGVMATIVYNANRFFLTNESVIQHIQVSLLSKKEQTINLNNIEDASFRQHGIFQELFGYGSIRLSTQGEETTYRFNYVSQPQRQISLLNNAVEAFKAGRPFDPGDN